LEKLAVFFGLQRWLCTHFATLTMMMPFICSCRNNKYIADSCLVQGTCTVAGTAAGAGVALEKN